MLNTKEVLTKQQAERKNIKLTGKYGSEEFQVSLENLLEAGRSNNVADLQDKIAEDVINTAFSNDDFKRTGFVNIDLEKGVAICENHKLMLLITKCIKRENNINDLTISFGSALSKSYLQIDSRFPVAIDKLFSRNLISTQRLIESNSAFVSLLEAINDKGIKSYNIEDLGEIVYSKDKFIIDLPKSNQSWSR